MEAGSWQRAAAELGSALSQARAGSPEGAQAAQYLAAVLLLQVRLLLSASCNQDHSLLHPACNAATPVPCDQETALSHLQACLYFRSAAA